MLFWPNLSRSSRISPRSHWISLDLMGFQVIFTGELQMLSVFASFHQKSFKYRRRFLVLWSSRVVRVLGEETHQSTRRVSGFVGTTRNWRRSGRFGRFSIRVRAGCLGWSVLRVGWTVLTTVATRLNVMTWSSRLRPWLDKGNYNNLSTKKRQIHHKNKLLEEIMSTPNHP